MTDRKERKSGGSPVLKTVIGGLMGCAASVALALAFSFVLMKQWLGMEALPFINAGIKAFCAGIAAFAAVRGAASRAILRGAAAGLVYMAVTSVVFSLLSGGFSIKPSALADAAVCAAVGAAVGIVHNLRQ